MTKKFCSLIRNNNYNSYDGYGKPFTINYNTYIFLCFLLDLSKHKQLKMNRMKDIRLVKSKNPAPILTGNDDKISSKVQLSELGVSLTDGVTSVTYIMNGIIQIISL